MSTHSYYQPLRTHILAGEDKLGQVSRDLAEHGLHYCMNSGPNGYVKEIMDAFEPVEDSEGTYLFQDATATCGEDWNDCWLDGSAKRMLGNALPGSYFEVVDTSCLDGMIPAFRFEHGKETRRREMVNPFDESALLWRLSERRDA